MRRKPTESEIVSSICDYLALRRHFFWRSNNLPVFDRHRSAFRAMPKHAMKGLPDICVIHEGRFIGLECKTEKGRQSEEQKEFDRLSRRAGGQYHVVRSIEDIQQLGL